MNILVCVKQVPDTTEIKIDPVKNTLIRDGVPSIVNSFPDIDHPHRPEGLPTNVKKTFVPQKKTGGVKINEPQSISQSKKALRPPLLTHCWYLQF